MVFKLNDYVLDIYAIGSLRRTISAGPSEMFHTKLQLYREVPNWVTIFSGILLL